MAECPVNIGDVLADKYRVERILGHGGMGIVVAAMHLELDQMVAMKFLLPSLAENREAAQRFRREARAAVKIRSEFVARVLDVGTMQDGIPYMVMEYLEGRDLAEEIGETGALNLEDSVRFLLQACEAIAVAHSVGIVHRDLKPANLFVTRGADRSRTVKVLDFGISKSIFGESGDSLSLTRTAALVGSPLYMSPEQLESARHVDERTDIWSLGVILFELVTGTVPFTGESIPQLVRAVLAGERQRVSDLTPDFGPELDVVLDRCLALDREQRFQSVAELTNALAVLTPAGVVSAQRVSRILNHSNADTPESGPARPAVQAAATAGENAPIAASGTKPNGHASQGSPKAPGAEETTSGSASWGRTRTEGRTNPRGTWIAVSILGVAAVAVTLWLVSDSQADADAEAAARGLGAHDPTGAPADDTHAPADAPTDEAHALATSLPTDAAAISGTAAAPPPPVDHSNAARARPPTTEPGSDTPRQRPGLHPGQSPKTAARPILKRTTPPSKPPSAPPATSTPNRGGGSPKGSFTDFGGRR